jgi:hypothetical protein
MAVHNQSIVDAVVPYNEIGVVGRPFHLNSVEEVEGEGVDDLPIPCIVNTEIILAFMFLEQGQKLATR